MSYQDMSSSAMLWPVAVVFGSSGSCSPMLAQCFWLNLGAKVAYFWPGSACALGWSLVCVAVWSVASYLVLLWEDFGLLDGYG